MLTVRALFIRKGTWLSGVIATAAAGSIWLFAEPSAVGLTSMDSRAEANNTLEKVYFLCIVSKVGIVFTGECFQ